MLMDTSINAVYYLGIDVASSSLSVCLLQRSVQQYQHRDFSNDTAGFQQLCTFLAEAGAGTHNCVVCLESTGVYSERLCHHLHDCGFALACEAPQKVQRAMHKQYKNDSIDARQIADYAWRYVDQLHWWKPPQQIMQQLRAVANARELLLQQRRATKNMLIALQCKATECPQAQEVLLQHVEFLEQQMKLLQLQMELLLQQQQSLKDEHQLLLSIPGVGTLLSVQILLLKQTLPAMNPKVLAAYLGICPHEHSSGSSVLRKPRSRRSGPGIFRRLLYLAAMSLCRNEKNFAAYMNRKVAQGKPKRLILNNVSNKIIRLACAVLNSATPFNAGFLDAPAAT